MRVAAHPRHTAIAVALARPRHLHAGAHRRRWFPTLGPPEVAQRSGFGSATVMGITFRKETALTPVEYRRRFSRGGEHEGHAD